VWTECIILKCQTCLCTKLVGFKRLNVGPLSSIGVNEEYHEIP